MMKTRCLLAGHGRVHWVLFEVVDRPFHVVDQQRAEIAADAVPDQNPLNRQILHIGGQRIGGHLPAASTQPICQVVEAEARVDAVFHFPAQRRNARVHLAVVDDLERSQLFDLVGDVLGRVVAGRVNLAVAFPAQSQEVVVLADDLAAGAREVQRDVAHVAAQVVHPEHQFVRQVLFFAPDDPADAQRRQAEFVARRVDRLDARNAEVPLQIRGTERREKAAAGTVDVHANVQPLVLLQLVQGVGDRFDRFVLAGEGHAQRRHDADGVLVARA